MVKGNIHLPCETSRLCVCLSVWNVGRAYHLTLWYTVYYGKDVEFNSLYKQALVDLTKKKEQIKFSVSLDNPYRANFRKSRS